MTGRSPIEAAPPGRRSAVTTPDRPRVVSLAAADRGDLAGGKAWHLSRLLAMGVPVPDGIVITTEAFETFLDACGLRARIDDLVRPLAASDRDRQADVARAIATLIEAAPLPEGLSDEIGRRARPWLDAGPVVVRSSAVGEDGRLASFAGQLDSVLDVRTGTDLDRAIRQCWASYWSARAIFYRLARGARLGGMGVIVQRQVAAVVSGVLFTREPGGAGTGPDAPAAGGAGDALIVEFTSGLADALVSGAADPGRIRIRRRDHAITVDQALPDAGERARVEPWLTPRRLLDLARLGLRFEDAFGAPQDVEWALDSSGALWIVQTRPITTLGGSTSQPSVLWSNVNVSENFPEPISPLLYSIASTGYAHYFRNLGAAFGISRTRLAAMARPLGGIIGVHGARMYYHLTNIHAVLRMAPFGEALAHAFNRFVGADRIAPPTPEALAFDTRRGRWVQAAELGRIVWCVARRYIRLGRRVAAFEEQARDFAAATTPDHLATRSLPALGRDLAAFVDIRRHRWTNAALADAAAMVAYAMLERQIRRVGAEPAAVNSLLRALPGVPSAQPPVALWRLSRAIIRDPELARLFSDASSADILRAIRQDDRHHDFRRLFEAYLDEWGFRSSAELMLTVPTLAERPEPVIDLLRQYARAGGESPDDVMRAQAAGRRRETRRLLARVGVRHPLATLALWRWIGWAQRAVVYRERVRLAQARLYTRVRAVALAIGSRLVEERRLQSSDDVFWFTWQELDEVCDGRSMFPTSLQSLADLRRREHVGVSATVPPDILHLPAGGWFDPATAGAARTSAPDAGRIETEPMATLHGTSACGGSVTAPAAVLRDVSEAHRLSRGDVLVTKQTDPGWGPLFCLVSGLVIERGGMLSHGAIIAREFGLPCVVGIAGATTRIAHKSRITVDGDRGVCRLESTT